MSQVMKTAEPDAMTPVDHLIEGVETFQTDIFPERQDHFRQLAQGQDPQVLFITCADSRVVPEMITQTEPGDLFVCRNIGNIVPGYGEMMGGVSAVIEYAVVALGVRDIIICGHSDCGAMKGLLVCDDPTVPERMPAVANWLRNADAARGIVEATRPDVTGDEKVQALVEQNVAVQLQHLRTHPAVAARLANDSLRIHGWVYDIATGSVQVHDPDSARLVPLARSSFAGSSVDRGGKATA